MNGIYINRGGQQYGPYGMDEVNRYLRDGTLCAADFAWSVGNEDWKPLAQLLGVSPPPSISADTLARRISDYERISGVLWIVLGVIQTITIVAAIAGVWNIFAGISRIMVAKPIARRDSSIPESFKNDLPMLIAIGVVNFLLGGIIGILFVAFDFYIRDLVLKNAHLFNRPTEIECEHEGK